MQYILCDMCRDTEQSEVEALLRQMISTGHLIQGAVSISLLWALACSYTGHTYQRHTIDCHPKLSPKTVTLNCHPEMHVMGGDAVFLCTSEGRNGGAGGSWQRVLLLVTMNWNTLA